MTASEASKIVRAVLCRGLSHEQAEQILNVMTPVKAEAGVMLFTEGQRQQGLMVLLAGTVDVYKQRSEQLLATMDEQFVEAKQFREWDA